MKHWQSCIKTKLTFTNDHNYSNYVAPVNCSYCKKTLKVMDSWIFCRYCKYEMRCAKTLTEINRFYHNEWLVYYVSDDGIYARKKHHLHFVSPGNQIDQSQLLNQLTLYEKLKG